MRPVLSHPHCFPPAPARGFPAWLSLGGAFRVPLWAGWPVALTDRWLAPGFHFLPFSSFRSCWLEVEVEGPWDAESRRLTPSQTAEQSKLLTDGTFP